MATQARRQIPRRASNARRIERRKQSWARGQVLRLAHKAAQDARKRANDILRAQGLPTPWHRAQERRRVARLPLQRSKETI